MAVPMYVHLFAFISIALNLFVIILILNKREQSKSKVTMLLVSSIVFVILWIAMTYLQITIYPRDKDIEMNLILSGISNVFAIAGLITLVSFVTYFVSPKIDFLKTVYLTSSLFLIIGLKLAQYVALKDVAIVSSIQTISDLLNVGIIISAVYFFSKDFQILLKEDLSDKQRTQVRSVYFALVISILGNVPIQIVASVVNFQYLAFSYIFFSFSLGFMIYAYLNDPRVIFILPEKTYLLLVVNSFGTMRFSKRFIKTNDFDDDAVLISGALRAITTLMSDFYKSPVTPETIRFQNKMILFTWSENYFVAIFCERDSTLIREAMRRTVMEINQRYGENIEKNMNAPQILQLEDIVDETFYFIY